MKKLILSGLLLATSLFVAAQSKTDSTAVKKGAAGNNEIKINVVYGILGLPELTYERILNDESAIGVSLSVAADDDISWKFGVVPYYRVYFGGKKASGFFIEGNAALITIKDYDFSNYSPNYSYSGRMEMTKQTTFGLGAAAGGKFLTKRGFIGEAYFGLGRLFKNRFEDIYPRLGITIGKRF